MVLLTVLERLDKIIHRYAVAIQTTSMTAKPTASNATTSVPLVLALLTTVKLAAELEDQQHQIVTVTMATLRMEC